MASPELLGPLGEGLRFIPIGYEVPLGTGRLDLLFLDSEGLLTLVETKLEANDESRRKVVGQVLEYASYAAEWTLDDVLHVAADYLAKQGASTQAKSLEEAAANVLGWTEDDEDIRAAKLGELLAKTAQNLADGHLRVVCGVDERIESLERLVRYLSAHSDLQVVLLQVNRFSVADDLVVMIPSLHGDISSEPSRQTRGQAPRRLTVDEIIGSFTDAKEEDAVRQLVDAARAEGAIFLTGPSGMSIRVRCPIKQEPVTVGWVFAPGKATWMRTRDVTFGHGLDYDSTPPALRELLNNYHARLVELGIGEDASSKGVRARWVTPTALSEQLSLLIAELRNVMKSVASLTGNSLST